MGKIFQLDLHAVELLGQEREKSRLVVESIMEGIRKQDKFPSVPVIELNGRFYITNGNHRAIGHYLANKPLTCELIPGGPPKSRLEFFFPIREIVLVEDTGQYKLFKDSSFYR
ncbi:MAG TPA: hypothetical protein VMC07_00935 [Candidatus Omnitrophota bacterium]|nr:hypothetical protein [Candidatus Omnitrophota bacterium]